MKLRIALETNDLRVGIAWDRLRRVFIVALPFLNIRFELAGGVVTRALPAPVIVVGTGMPPDAAALVAAIMRDPHLPWQELRKRMDLTAQRAVVAREWLTAEGKIVPDRNAAGQRVLRVVEG